MCYHGEHHIGSESDVRDLPRQHTTRVVVAAQTQQRQRDPEERRSHGDHDRCSRQLHRPRLVGHFQRHHSNYRHLPEHELLVRTDHSTHHRHSVFPTRALEPWSYVQTDRVFLHRLASVSFGHSVVSASVSRDSADVQLLSCLFGHRDLSVAFGMGFALSEVQA